MNRPKCDDCPGRSHPRCCWNFDNRPANSEVAQLMQRIATENEAAQRGLTGISEGTAKHQFLHAHMERMWALRGDLAQQVGNEDQATTMICQVLLSES